MLVHGGLILEIFFQNVFNKLVSCPGKLRERFIYTHIYIYFLIRNRFAASDVKWHRAHHTNVNNFANFMSLAADALNRNERKKKREKNICILVRVSLVFPISA